MQDCEINSLIDILLNRYKFDCMPRDFPIFHLDNLKLFDNKFCKQGELILKNLNYKLSKPCSKDMSPAM